MAKTVKRPSQEPAGRIAVANAARRLFHEQGYTAATIASIAEEAGYAVQTVYFHFKTKAAIVRYLVDRMKAETISPTFSRSMEDQPAESRLHATAAIARRTCEAWWDVYEVMRSAARTEDALAALVAEMDSGRLYGQRKIAKTMAARGELARGVDVKMAIDILWTLASEDTYQRLVVDRKWSPDRYEKWLGACLCQQLLGTS